jgi:hypothetical protein
MFLSFHVTATFDARASASSEKMRNAFKAATKLGVFDDALSMPSLQKNSFI